MYRAASLAGPLASRAASGSRHRLSGALVSAQLAFALILLLGASLFLRSPLRVHALDSGYDASGVLTARLTSPTNERAKTPAGQAAFYREALVRVRAIPGVGDATWAAGLPLTVFGGSGSFQIRGRTDKPGEAWPHGLRRYVTPGFLNVLRVPLHRGRFFREADRENSEPVCVIDEQMARQYWPDRDPIGDEITVDGQPRARIVGVVGHISQGSPSASDMKGEYLFPLYQHPRSEVAIAIRTAGGGDPLSLATALRETLQRLAPAQAVYSIRTLQDRLDETLAGRRSGALAWRDRGIRSGRSRGRRTYSGTRPASGAGRHPCAGPVDAVGAMPSPGCGRCMCGAYGHGGRHASASYPDSV